MQGRLAALVLLGHDTTVHGRKALHPAAAGRRHILADVSRPGHRQTQAHQWPRTTLIAELAHRCLQLLVEDDVAPVRAGSDGQRHIAMLQLMADGVADQRCHGPLS